MKQKTKTNDSCLRMIRLSTRLENCISDVVAVDAGVDAAVAALMKQRRSFEMQKTAVVVVAFGSLLVLDDIASTVESDGAPTSPWMLTMMTHQHQHLDW